jgi:hypothetical protein
VNQYSVCPRATAVASHIDCNRRVISILDDVLILLNRKKKKKKRANKLKAIENGAWI